MGVLCTCVRAGWTVVSALLSLGSSWVRRNLTHLFQFWTRSVKVVGQQSAVGFEPTHELVCLDAALGCMLSFVRSYVLKATTLFQPLQRCKTKKLFAAARSRSPLPFHTHFQVPGSILPRTGVADAGHCHFDACGGAHQWTGSAERRPIGASLQAGQV